MSLLEGVSIVVIGTVILLVIVMLIAIKLGAGID